MINTHYTIHPIHRAAAPARDALGVPMRRHTVYAGPIDAPDAVPNDRFKAAVIGNHLVALHSFGCAWVVTPLKTRFTAGLHPIIGELVDTRFALPALLTRPGVPAAEPAQRGHMYANGSAGLDRLTGAACALSLYLGRVQVVIDDRVYTCPGWLMLGVAAPAADGAASVTAVDLLNAPVDADQLLRFMSSRGPTGSGAVDHGRLLDDAWFTEHTVLVGSDAVLNLGPRWLTVAEATALRRLAR